MKLVQLRKLIREELGNMLSSANEGLSAELEEALLDAGLQHAATSQDDSLVMRGDVRNQVFNAIRPILIDEKGFTLKTSPESACFTKGNVTVTISQLETGPHAEVSIDIRPEARPDMNTKYAVGPGPSLPSRR